jgi:hypothetical protein
MTRRAIIIFTFIFKGLSLFGQQKTDLPVGIFLKDSIKLGEIVNYAFSYKHRANQEIFFVDKAFDYQPFELVEKVYFPTQTTNGISLDSAVYKLRTFKIDTFQKLKLPVFILSQQDSLKLYSNADSIFLIHEIKANPEFLNLKTSDGLLPMKKNIDLYQIFGQLLLFGLFLGGWWLIFRKSIISQIKNFRLAQSHREFTANFTKLTKTTTKTNLEKAISQWKKYIGKLEKKSFATMTSPEILENIPDESLETALKEIDKSIYGNSISENIQEALYTLSALANKSFLRRKNEIVIQKKKG